MMTTRGIVNPVEVRDASDNGPRGAATVETESEGKPSTDFGASTQSPIRVSNQPKGPTVVATFKGNE